MTEPTELQPAAEATEDNPRDFTKRRSPIVMTIGGDRFRAPSMLSLVAIRKVGALLPSLEKLKHLTTASPEEIEQLLGSIGEIFKILLPGEKGNGVRLAERLLDEEDPIDLFGEAMPMVYYLFERYGLNRPTQQSSHSSVPAMTGDSTDGVQPEELIPSDLTSLDT